MKQNFEKIETELIEPLMIQKLKEIEQSIKTLSNQRLVLKRIIDKVKEQRPEDYVEKTPVRKMFSSKFEENESIAAKINYILGHENDPLTSSEVTERYISLIPKAGVGKKREKLLKNISTILSIGNGKKYERVKSDEKGKYAYQLKKEDQLVLA